MPYTRFETEIVVRPDDIDMNNHVHHSKYLDYVLAARFDQMGRCYGMSMDAFLKHGWTWFQKSFSIEYKRPLNVGETVVVRTWLQSFEKSDVTVHFEILRRSTMKICAEGFFVSTMVDVKTGRAVRIPNWAIARYTQFVA